MIDIKKLTNKDIGREVYYNSFNKTEFGIIKSWNDKWIFVVYKCGEDWENFTNY
jgi:hypothetical protein